MNLKKIWIACCLCILTLSPIQAKTNKDIVIVSKQLPYIIIAQIKDSTHMNVRFVPTQLRLPIACHNDEITTLKSVDLKKQYACAIDSVEQFFSIQSDRYVYLHLDRIAKTLDLPYKQLDFNNISNLTSYFSNIVKKLKISMILHYDDYVKSNLNVSDYYDYYQMFKGKHVSITYSYVNQILLENESIPMDNVFHKKSTK